MDEPPLLIRCVMLAVVVLMLLGPGIAVADPGPTPLFHYGIGDGHLYRPTAFAESWTRPDWVPDRVLRDWPGIALAGLAPGTRVRITVVGLPGWAASWPELDDVIGRSTIAYVSDRPGENWYGDAWPVTFLALTNGRLWVGKLYVKYEVWEAASPVQARQWSWIRQRSNRWKAEVVDDILIGEGR